MNKPFPLPVRMVGAGSQPEDEEQLQYLDMPRGMDTFSMPSVPDNADPDAIRRAREVLRQFLVQLDAWNPATQPQGPRLDLANVAADALKVLNETLGEGEVAVQSSGAWQLKIQESLFAGLWRVCVLDADGRLAADWLEAAPIPEVVGDVARADSGDSLREVAIPDGAMNSPALLVEITAQLNERAPGSPAHVLNLTLFPLSPQDHEVLEAALPVGAVAMMSRGFGNCRITSTGTRGVWRVQYFNNMNTMILNTIEVVGMPEVALAAVEDLEDSKVRLAELVDWMDEAYAEPAAG